MQNPRQGVRNGGPIGSSPGSATRSCKIWRTSRGTSFSEQILRGIVLIRAD